jgi:predicted Zn-dependent protease
VLAGGPAPSTPTAGPAGSAAGPAAAPASPGPALATGDPAPTQDDLDVAMSEANRAYDRGDLDEARTLASRLLARQPTNVRMLRIMVSVSCIDGDAAAALASFTKLPAADQAQMRVRCARYGVAFPGP